MHFVSHFWQERVSCGAYPEVDLRSTQLRADARESTAGALSPGYATTAASAAAITATTKSKFDKVLALHSRSHELDLIDGISGAIDRALVLMLDSWMVVYKGLSKIYPGGGRPRR